MQQVLVKEIKETEKATKFLGSYMPFVGVRFYTLLSEQDIRDGKTKTGAVGWRLRKGFISQADEMDFISNLANI